MSDFTNEMKSSNYEKEITNALQRVAEKMPYYHEYRYFEKIVSNHYLSVSRNAIPKIIVLGSGFPEELIVAAGKMPYWILGGSRESSMWADDLVPRDTDPVSRSSLGYIKSDLGKNALILITLVNDSSRKLAYILKSTGHKVQTFHFPPLKDADSIMEWNRQYEACRSTLTFHLKKPITKRAIQKAEKEIRYAKRRIREFLEVCEGMIEGTCRIFVLNSYYCADDLSEWSNHLKRLTEKIRRERKYKYRVGVRSKVLLLGSPVYFPNYKIPFLIEDVGLTISVQTDYTTLKMQSGIWQERGEETNYYFNDTSPAYVKNDSFYKQVMRVVSENAIDGVVYHVLKGQIEYDFELERFENLFEMINVPVFRLETDYNYQDVEQLRIRLEAFSEVLNQRRYSKGELAV